MKLIYHKIHPALFASLLIMIFFISACQKNIEPTPVNDEVAGTSNRDHNNLKDFTQVNLVSDVNAYHPARIDPRLVNAWGIAFAPSGPAWVSAEGTGLSVVYNKEGNDVRPEVTIP